MGVQEYYPTWWYRGMVYGYPDCCVVNFCLRGLALEKGEPQLGKFFEFRGKPTGYVMCPECAKKTRKEIIDTINSRRDPRLPRFPSHAI